MKIKLDNLWYRYLGSSRWSLKNISLELGEEITVILGPNGSGKTTLLKLASLIYKPIKGRVEINGKDFWSIKRADERTSIRRSIVYVHENPILIRGTALENIAYGLIIRGYEKERALRIADRLMESFNAGHLKERSRSNLSAGEAQLVSIMRALAISPSILLLDEPITHLDLEKRKALIRMLRSKLKEGLRLVMATHDHQMAAELADKIVLLEDGEIIAEGRPEEVLR